MKIFIISIFTLVAVLTVAFTTFNTSVVLSEESANNQEVTLKVDGMTCKMCTITLKRLDGVIDAEVSYKYKEAKVRYEEGKVTVDEMIKAIENAGNYRVTPLSKEGR
jgi:copper chaperone CopZ